MYQGKDYDKLKEKAIESNFVYDLTTHVLNNLSDHDSYC